MPDNGVILVFADEPSAQLHLECAITQKAKTKNVKLFFAILWSSPLAPCAPKCLHDHTGVASEQAYERLSEGRIFRSSGGPLNFDSKAFFDSVIRIVNIIFVIHMIRSSCQLIVIILIKFPPPPKSYATIFLEMHRTFFWSN